MGLRLTGGVGRAEQAGSVQALSERAVGGRSVEGAGAVAGVTRAQLQRQLHDFGGLATAATGAGASGGSAAIRDPTREAGSGGLGHLGSLEVDGREHQLWGFTLTLGYSRPGWRKRRWTRNSAPCCGCMRKRSGSWAAYRNRAQTKGKVESGVHGTTRQPVFARWDAEQFRLQPMAGRPAYPYCDDELRKVARDVRFQFSTLDRGTAYSAAAHRALCAGGQQRNLSWPSRSCDIVSHLFRYLEIKNVDPFGFELAGRELGS
jgi:hypothetical protein